MGLTPLSWAILGTCTGACLLMMAIGAVVAAKAQTRFEQRLAVLEESAQLTLDPNRVAGALARLERSAAEAAALSARAGAALAKLSAGLKELRIPEVLMALRIAGSTIRAILR